MTSSCFSSLVPNPIQTLVLKLTFLRRATTFLKDLFLSFSHVLFQQLFFLSEQEIGLLFYFLMQHLPVIFQHHLFSFTKSFLASIIQIGASIKQIGLFILAHVLYLYCPKLNQVFCFRVRKQVPFKFLKVLILRSKKVYIFNIKVAPFPLKLYEKYPQNGGIFFQLKIGQKYLLGPPLKTPIFIVFILKLVHVFLVLMFFYIYFLFLVLFSSLNLFF